MAAVKVLAELEEETGLICEEMKNLKLRHHTKKNQVKIRPKQAEPLSSLNVTNPEFTLTIWEFPTT